MKKLQSTLCANIQTNAPSSFLDIVGAYLLE
jgi:hypothetical protein